MPRPVDPGPPRPGDGFVGAVRFIAGDSAPRVHFRYEYKREDKKVWHSSASRCASAC